MYKNHPHANRCFYIYLWIIVGVKMKHVHMFNKYGKYSRSNLQQESVNSDEVLQLTVWVIILVLGFFFFK